MSINNQDVVNGLKKYPLIAVCGVISVLLLLSFYFRSSALADQQVELEKYSSDAKRYQANVSNAAQLSEQLKFLLQANEAVSKRALPSEGMAEKLQYLYRLESETGVKYLDLRQGPKFKFDAKKPVSYVPINYALTVQGDFKQVITFLRYLEQGVYFTRITSASISGSGASVKINLNVDLLGIP